MPQKVDFTKVNTAGYVMSFGGILIVPTEETLGATREEVPMSVYKRGAESPFYQMTVTHPNGRVVRKSTRTADKVEAERFERAYRTKHGISESFFDNSQSITFKELWEKCIAHWQVTNPRSWKTYYASHQLAILKVFSERYIDQIDQSDINVWRDARLANFKPGHSGKRISKNTVIHGLAVLKEAFNLAKGWGLLKRTNPPNTNPVAGVKFPESPKGRMHPLSADEKRRLFGVLQEPFLSLATVAMWTGFRKSELIGIPGMKGGLCHHNVNFLTKTITLTEVTKTDESRSVPFGKTLETVLRNLCEGKRHKDPLFSKIGRFGTVVDLTKNFDRTWNGYCKLAGLEDFHFHDLRHTFATDLVRAGCHMRVLQRLLGHKTPEMTARYAHPTDEITRAEFDKLEAQQEVFASSVTQ